ncbi:hypothetical protein L1077_21190 [Pseudoalteromonas luteoviolacea]|uniref:hypothetical protein n=1 Tax=Pseudoalteromonas luteoviolacea TaxID=43657 RepID=UPI001F1893E8|nr:hypothetical protein [Pseudoalteromonas luteoviolacea]MCF6441947.1 hypothetical protein [Pseudoalteromonas luteoviolacea]
MSTLGASISASYFLFLLQGTVDFQSPSREYHYALHSGSMKKPVLEQGSRLSKGEVILQYQKRDTAEFTSLKSIGEGWLVEVHSDAKIEAGNLLAIVQSESIQGIFNPSDASELGQLRPSESYWLCIEGQEYQIVIEHILKSKVLISMKRTKESLSYENKVSIYEEAKNCPKHGGALGLHVRDLQM